MSLRREPILWVGLAIIILQGVHTVLAGGYLSVDLTNQLLVAVGALLGRQLVSPLDKHE